MNAHLDPKIGELMEGLGKAAVQAASVLALANTARKNMALAAAALCRSGTEGRDSGRQRT